MFLYLANSILQEIIAFQTDKSIEVKKFVIGFIEEAWLVVCVNILHLIHF